MQASNSFKGAFLKNLLLGLKQAGVAVAPKDMSLRDRKKAIKLAADVTLASTRGSTAKWSCALMTQLSEKEENRAMIRGILGTHSMQGFKRTTQLKHWKVTRSKKILKKSFRARPKTMKMTARAMVKRRIQVLKKIVPGGKGLDDCSLLGETLDYAVCLKAQVDVMQMLVKALQGPKP